MPVPHAWLSAWTRAANSLSFAAAVRIRCLSGSTVSVGPIVDEPIMRPIHSRLAVALSLLVCSATGCRNNTTGDDPFNQRRIVAPPPAANYAPPNVQLQPVPGPQPGVQTAPGQWVPQGGAQPGMFRPASATTPAAGAGSDGWVPADKPTSPPDHSAALTPATTTPALQPTPSAQPAAVAQAAAEKSTASLGWTVPRLP
jgi:hypothetical protein